MNTSGGNSHYFDQLNPNNNSYWQSRDKDKRSCSWDSR